MNEWLSGLAFWQQGLLWVAASLVLGLVVLRIQSGRQWRWQRGPRG